MSYPPFERGFQGFIFSSGKRQFMISFRVEWILAQEKNCYGRNPSESNFNKAGLVKRKTMKNKSLTNTMKAGEPHVGG